MRTFIVNADKSSIFYKKPLCNWGSLPQDTYYEGVVPNGYNLAVNPTPGIIIVDVDVDDDKCKNGCNNIPGYLYFKNPDLDNSKLKLDIYSELKSTYHYYTKRGGQHFWLHYTGSKILMNKASNQSIDLRIGPEVIDNKIVNNGGYAIYYPANKGDDIRNHLSEIKDTSPAMNEFLETLFC